MAYLMIVDDDEDFATAASIVLTRGGHEVQIKMDTADAFQSMLARRPDLVILDVMFPENPSAGFDLARTMRHDHEDFKGVPILMLTAVNMKFPLGFGPGDIDDAWLPISEFLEKPVDLDVMRSKVEALLARAEPPSARDR